MCYPLAMSTNYSIYVHIPFCLHRCSYCDFNTYAGVSELIPDYIEALAKEIRAVAESKSVNLEIKSIYFGGGTPSLVHPRLIHKVISAVGSNFNILPQVEITIEANPGTVSISSLKEISQIGVNRISFGMQSAHTNELSLLERQHNLLDVQNAVKWAREAGIANINLDLIYGIPWQTLERWEGTLNRALSFRPEHLSLYGLTIEPGTPLNQWINRGLLSAPDDDLSADMYEVACERLESSGFFHYEISNWARKGPVNAAVCLHNLQYWRNEPYLGFGAGAHGFASGYRTANVPDILTYISRCDQCGHREFPIGLAADTVIKIDSWSEMQETMMVGLRLVDEGVSKTRFKTRFGVNLEDVFGKTIQELFQQGLLAWVDDPEPSLRLTKRGLLLGNRVFEKFINQKSPINVQRVN